MTNTLKRILRTGAWSLASACLLASAHDQGPGAGLSEFDLNDDGTISQAEFTTAGTSLAQELQARFLAKYDAIPTGATAGDGVVTTAEAQALFEEQATDWLEHVLDTFDTNGDGAISDADTLRGRRHPGRLHLEEYDANDDGTVSQAELQAAAVEKVETQLARFLAKYDSVPAGATAGDGVITSAESLAIAQAAVDERIQAILERFDSNDDGAVSQEEIAALTNKAPKHKRGPVGRPGRGR